MTDYPTKTDAHTHWHQKRLDALQAENGWLTLIDLIWLDDGQHKIGTSADCTIRLPTRSALDSEWGQLTVRGNSAEWHATGGQPRPLRSDRDGTPEIIRHGAISFFLIEREQGLGLRVRDQQAATRTGFRGIELFPFDPDWQVHAQWDGHLAHFDMAGEHQLRPQDSGAETLQFVIADQTSGKETYGGGRFLFVPRPADNRLTLDFNRAINPPCAFTPFAVCPLPPPENRLPFPIAAGEKRYR
jgi:uncharacterized protein (DUF1684 family)